MMKLHSFELALAAAWPPSNWQDTGVLVAVSGGADSVALVRALAAIKAPGRGRLTVGHFNHRLRADASQDAGFVAELVTRLRLPFELGHADTAATAQIDGDGIEAAARHERYRFLQSAAESLGARYVVSAHTADDQAETILHRILRGTSVAGLAGMRRVRPLGDAVTLIRPMLALRRTDVLAYLEHLGQPHREDASNASLAHTRNRLRHSLLPQMKADYNADVIAALVRLGESAGDAQRVIDRLVAERIEAAVRFPGTSECLVDCGRLAADNRHLIRELFVAIWRRQSWPRQSMGFDHWDRLAAMMLPGGAPKQTFPGGIVAERMGPTLSLVRSA